MRQLLSDITGLALIALGFVLFLTPMVLVLIAAGKL
jgi:hypothetical protein